MDAEKKPPRERMIYKFKKGFVLGGNFVIEKQLGQGNNSTVYRANPVNNGPPVAIKVQTNLLFGNGILNEFGCYEKLKQKLCEDSNEPFMFPLVYLRVKDMKYNYLVMEIMGPSIQNVFNHNSKCFGEKEILVLFQKMISQLQGVHSIGLAHCDVKPSNMCLRNGETNMDSAMLIDFGMALGLRKELPKICSHQDYFFGSIRYAPLSMHEGKTYSQKDDIESLIYSMMYLQNGELPWQLDAEIELPFNIRNEVALKWKKRAAEKVCQGYYPVFADCLAHIRSLEFDSAPDYDRLRDIVELRLADMTLDDVDMDSPMDSLRGDVGTLFDPAAIKKYVDPVSFNCDFTIREKRPETIRKERAEERANLRWKHIERMEREWDRRELLNKKNVGQKTWEDKDRITDPESHYGMLKNDLRRDLNGGYNKYEKKYNRQEIIESRERIEQNEHQQHKESKEEIQEKGQKGGTDTKLKIPDIEPMEGETVFNSIDEIPKNFKGIAVVKQAVYAHNLKPVHPNGTYISIEEASRRREAKMEQERKEKRARFYEDLRIRRMNRVGYRKEGGPPGPRAQFFNYDRSFNVKDVSGKTRNLEKSGVEKGTNKTLLGAERGTNGLGNGVQKVNDKGSDPRDRGSQRGITPSRSDRRQGTKRNSLEVERPAQFGLVSEEELKKIEDSEKGCNKNLDNDIDSLSGPCCKEDDGKGANKRRKQA